MKPIRVMIIDDEPPARMAISALLANQSDVDVVAEIPDGIAALSAIRELRPHLVFLDVQMPGLNGLQVLDALGANDRPVIIFVTAFDQHAIRAFEFSAVDYLVKPFSDERFLAAFERARGAIQRQHGEETERRLRRLLDHALARTSSRLAFKVGGDRHIVPAHEILWIEAQNDFVKVAAEGQIHLVRESLQEIQERLDPEIFVRVHRSFVVNLERVRKVTHGIYGELALQLSDGTKVPVSRSRRASLAALME